MRLPPFWAASVGVAESFLMSYETNHQYHATRSKAMRQSVSEEMLGRKAAIGHWRPHLLQSLVVDKTRGIFGDFELSLLNLLAKLPKARVISVSHTALNGWDASRIAASYMLALSASKRFGACDQLRPSSSLFYWVARKGSRVQRGCAPTSSQPSASCMTGSINASPWPSNRKR